MKQNCVCEPDVTQAQMEELVGSEEVIMTQKKEETESAEESESVMKKICDPVSDEKRQQGEVTDLKKKKAHLLSGCW